MKEFPNFMKSPLNHIDSTQQNTQNIDGYTIKVQMGVKSAFGHTILTEIQKRMFMNLTNMYFVFPENM